jgi:hypothetical protein
MNWILIIAAAWPASAALAALVLGRTIGLADQKAAEAEDCAPNFVVQPAFPRA